LNTLLVLKHCLGGAWDSQNECTGVKWYTTYMHIVTNKDMLTRDYDVKQGDQVGTIFNQLENSHLHFEVGLKERSYENFVNPWGRDEVPWHGCMWLDQSLCPNPDPNAERAALFNNSALYIKQGDDSILINDAQDVKKIRLWQDRIALMDSQGRLYLRDGKFNAGEDSLQNWIPFVERISDFEIAAQRVAILDMGGNLLINETNQPSQWIPQAGNVRAFSISNHRIGFLAADGRVYVKEGNLQNEWILISENVSAFQVSDNRIAILDLQGNLSVNEGDLDAEWKPQGEHIRAFQLTNLRVGILDAENNLLVKEGNLRAEFVQVAKNINAFQLSNYRLWLRSADGRFKYQTGNIYQPLNALSADFQGIFLNDVMPVYAP
jgi:hypothetical protein